MALAIGSPADAGMNRMVMARDLPLEQAMQGSAAHADTVWFGGSGSGNGSVVRGGIWNWETDSGEIAEHFLDGDFVGNEYRDGWTFEDRTTKHGPSPIGSPHFNSAGIYDFNYDATPQGGLRPGGFAHRATTHANNGINDGPNPLAGGWSLWIGTNLELSPEHCGWAQVRGYGDGWSQGITKSFAVPAGSAGVQYDLAFRHRYAVEAGHDTCWIETSFDGVFWDQVGTAINPNGIFTGGTAQSPLPSPAGGDQIVNLLAWPTGTPGNLHVRFRLAADAFRSDQADGGDYGYAWQIDNVTLLRNGIAVPGETTNFEAGYNGWQVATFEGYDFQLTLEPNRPAGRIARLSALSCPPLPPCPEQCGIESRIVLFSDVDDCDLGDGYMDSYITSPAFAIGGPSQPDLDDNAGRLLQYDLYMDGGAGMFEIVTSVCAVYWPFNSFHCPFAPPGGHPGAGTTFNWSQTGTEFCHLIDQGTFTACGDNRIDDLSAFVPADADSVILQVGVLSQCRYNAMCDPNDNGTPFYDNFRFGVYDPETFIGSATVHRYSDNFPTANGNILTQTARTDDAYLGTPIDGIENPVRGARGDSSVVDAGGDNIGVYLRFRVTPGPCQPNLGHAFFTAFPPGQWHAALMDTARQYTFNVPGHYMTCFSEQDPRNGTFWTGTPPPVEPCDDILPDGLFTPGTVIHYFYEVRPWGSGAVIGTFPRRADGGPIGTAANFASLWLETSVLPALDPACNGTYAHNMLVVNDYASTAVPGMASVLRDRLTATLASLGLEFDVYDVVAANYPQNYDGIGRREDRMSQAPRPPLNGATQQQLEPYDCIWYTAGLSKSQTLSDSRTVSIFGGQPSNDQQKLHTWLSGCTAGNNRLLVLEGSGWASDIDVNTTNGPSFLTNRGVDVLADDYAQDLAADDQRRCARITGTALAPDAVGEVFASGCPDNYELDVLHTLNGGEALAFYVESLEDGNDPVQCADDVPRPEWQVVVRRATGTGNCQRSVAMSFPLADFLPPNCVEQCLFDDYQINGPNAELVIDLFQWAGQPVNPSVIGVGAGGAPAIVAGLSAPRPNPAQRGPAIRYSIAARGRVQLKIYDVGGRLVRTLVDDVQEPSAAGFEVVWDGTTDAGSHAGSGVYFYELDSPGFIATKKLVLLE